MRIACRLIWATLVLSASAPAAAMDLSGELGVVSDYRYRGVSLSNGKPAVQGSLTLEHETGLYGQLWSSTLGSPRGPLDAEVDITAGYAASLTDAISLDLSATYYVYPKAGDENYFDATAIATAELGGGSAGIGVSFVPRQHGTRDENGRGQRNTYLFAEANYEIPGAPVTLNARFGRERGWFDEVERGGKWDWSLGAEVAVHSARLGFGYTGSNADSGDRHGVVASLFFDW